ncbi:MAG TPA: menaquinone biosynthesis protein [Pyrinomonadaceae bacterium]|nr:menaquinone biosynthesis protein [Pyrinomonadaceae bacterium]
MKSAELSDQSEKIKACAVSYLNTVPLVWGMLHGNQRERFDLTFGVPAQTAEALKTGTADIGILSTIELPRQNLKHVPGLGIVSRGGVRSIFLIANRPIGELRTLAADASSRTSVALCSIILKRRFSVEPEVISAPPDLTGMLRLADAALIIGDPALRLDPNALPHEVYDLGHEWTEMTGLPMVYAVWAVRNDASSAALGNSLLDSYRYGRDHIDDIVEAEAGRRGFTKPLARKYLTEHLAFEVGPDEERGMELYLKYASELNLI